MMNATLSFQYDFTVIIPFRDCTELLERAINSIPNNKQIQILAIDNGLVPLKNDYFAHQRINVEILYADNTKGAGHARNVGLENAKGKWILFLDADDFFVNNAFDVFYSEYDSREEIIYFKMTSCYSDTGFPADRGALFNKLIDNYLQGNVDADRLVRYKFVSPCAKMVAFNLIRRGKIYFDEVLVSNDVMFSLYTGFHATTIKCINQVVYCATVTRGSLTNRLTLETLMARYLVGLRYNKFLRKNNAGKYQSSIMYSLVYSWRYGLRVGCRFLWLCVCYRNNPFIGMRNWLSTYMKLKKDRKKNRNYIVNR